MTIVKLQITVDAQPKKWQLDSGIRGFSEYSNSRGVMDNIEFCDTFGITNKEDYIDQIWLRKEINYWFSDLSSVIC